MSSMFNRLIHSSSESSVRHEGEVAEYAQAGVCDSIQIKNVSVQDCVQVITDYEKYPEFMSLFSSVFIKQHGIDRSTSANDEMFVVEYNVQTTFKNACYILQVKKHCDLNRQHAIINWTLVQGPFRYNNGYWELTQMGSDVLAKYSLDMAFSIQVPKMIKSWIMTKVLQNSMMSMENRIKQVALERSTIHGTTLT